MLRTQPRSEDSTLRLARWAQPRSCRCVGRFLAEAGILSRRKAGVSVFCRIADPAIFDLCRHVCGGLQGELRRKGEASKMFAL